MVADPKKMAQGELGRLFDFPYFDLGVTSHDLSMNLTFFTFGCKCMEVSTETVGVGMV